MTNPNTEGYFALPAGGSGPGVLVLHPWWGLNATIRAFCQRLAAEGFVVLAPDLYHGQVTDQIPQAEALAGALGARSAEACSELLNAAAILDRAGTPSSSGISVIGFSLGAAYALELSGSAPERVRKVVTYYGTGGGEFTQSRASYLAHYAADDPYEPPESAAWLEAELSEAGRQATFYFYPGTGHWFAEPDRADAYDAQAAGLAWDRTLAFLKG